MFTFDPEKVINSRYKTKCSYICCTNNATLYYKDDNNYYSCDKNKVIKSHIIYDKFMLNEFNNVKIVYLCLDESKKIGHILEKSINDNILKSKHNVFYSDYLNGVKSFMKYIEKVKYDVFSESSSKFYINLAVKIKEGFNKDIRYKEMQKKRNKKSKDDSLSI